MKMCKKIIMLLLAAMMAFSFCACDTYYNVSVTEEDTTEPPSTKPAFETGVYTTVAKEETFDYTDKSGNVYKATYQIPRINLVGADADMINKEITEKFYKDFLAAETEQANRSSLTCDSLDYERFINGNVLSVVIKRVYFSHAVDYTVYSFNTSTCTLLDSKGVVTAIGRSYPEVKEQIRAELEKDYVNKYNTANPPQYYKENYEKTLSDDNMEKAKIYINEKGKITAVCKEYASVGNGEFAVVITLD